MVISLKKAILPFLLIVCTVVTLVLLAYKLTVRRKGPAALLGGAVHTMSIPPGPQTKAADFDSSRFERPSSQPALENKYTFVLFDKSRTNEPFSLSGFQTPEDVILAFFGILRDAANMAGYSGGCGTIGWSKLPYPYAYELLSADRQKNMPLKQFEDSFRGIGHITLLKLYPAFLPPGTPENVRYHMVEAEVITGAPSGDPAGFGSGGHFAYFYGIVTTGRDKKDGWKIITIDYFPEDFLCAPLHGWAYESQTLVPIVYQNWYHLIDRVDKTEQKGNMISVYASGGEKQYRFDFVRITNGTDVLLHEMVSKNGKWVETDLLKDEDQVLKLSIWNPNLKQSLS